MILVELEILYLALFRTVFHELAFATRFQFGDFVVFVLQTVRTSSDSFSNQIHFSLTSIQDVHEKRGLLRFLFHDFQIFRLDSKITISKMNVNFAMFAKLSLFLFWFWAESPCARNSVARYFHQKTTNISWNRRRNHGKNSFNWKTLEEGIFLFRMISQSKLTVVLHNCKIRTVFPCINT